MRMYQAFICCSHADRRWGERLHRDLARYRLPKNDGAQQAGPLFLDKTETPTSAVFGDPVERALAESDWLIVPCTPDTGRSVWINEQILRFQKQGDGDRVLCLIVSGQPGGSAMAGLENRECLPEAVRALGLSSVPKTDAKGAQIIADIRSGHGDWQTAIRTVAGVMAGVEPDLLRAHEGRRRLLRRLAVAGAFAVAIGIAIATFAAKQRMDHSAMIQSARTSALAAHSALDSGDFRGALRALQPMLTGDNTAPSDDELPTEAITALSRITRDTRLLAEIPVPASNVETLRLLPTGVLAAVEEDGRTHLIDIGAGDVTTVYDPSQATFTQISEDGRTLWTAHFEPSRLDETGEEVAPLVFEEAELATGTVRLVTAVQSIPADGGSAEISPDGRLFAIDLGPGAGEETVIAVFHREAQALAGVLTLPSDQAELYFVGSDHLLVLTDPPGEWDSAPGIYIWRIGDETARTLRRPGIAPICRGTIAAPDLPPAVVSLSPDRTEVALALSGTANHGCLLRWSLPSGQERQIIHMAVAAEHVTTLAAGGPYLFQSNEGEAWLLPGALHRPAQPVPGCASGSTIRSFGRANDRLVLCIAENGSGTLHRPGGITVWRGMMHQGGVSALAYDRQGRRLFTIGEDAVLRIWDAAPRLASVAAGIAAPGIATTQDGDTLIIGQDRVRRWDRAGVPTGVAVELSGGWGQSPNVLPLTGTLVGVTEMTGQGAAFAIYDMADDTAVKTGAAPLPLTRFTGLGPAGPGSVSVSPTGRRFLLLDDAGRAIWGNGVTGGPINRVELSGPRPILSGAAGEQGYVLIASDPEPDPAAGAARNFYLYSGGESATPGQVGEWRGQSAAVTLSTDGKKALMVIDRAAPARAEVALIDLKSGAERPVASFLSGPHQVGFSPDGRYVHIIAAAEQAVTDASGKPVSGMLIADADDGTRLRDLSPSSTRAPVWSPDGDYIAAPDGGLFSIRAGGRVCENLIRTDAQSFAFDTLSRRVAAEQGASGETSAIVIADLETCTKLTGFGADLQGASPKFITTDTLWVPFPTGVVAVPLTMNPAQMRGAAADRSARLVIEEER